jgi:PAS domain S-box-containing protein
MCNDDELYGFPGGAAKSRLSETFEQAGIGIIHVGLDGGLLRANPAFCRLVGKAHDELLGLSIAELVLSVGADTGRSPLEALEAEGAARWDARIVRPGGETVWVEAIATLVGTTGGTAYALVLLLDVTRRRAAEVEARDKLSRLEAFYEEAFEGIGLTDRGRILDVNPRICEMFGYEPDELIGSSIARLVHPDDMEEVERKIRSGFSGSYEHRCLHKDGSERYVEVQGKQVEYQGRTVRLTAIHDITERKTAEVQLARWAHLFEHAAWGIGISDAAGEHVARVNPAFARMHHCSSAQLESTPIDELYAPNVREDYWKAVQIADAQGHYTFRSRHVCRDGSEFPVEVGISVVRDDEGRLLYRAAHVQDITRELALQQQLEQSQRMEALGVLAGGIAHDFNNLLTGIMGYADLVQMSLEPDSVDHRDLEELLHAARRGKELVQQILTFSRRAESAKTQINPIDLVSEAHRLLRASFPSTIPIELHLPPSCPPILGDSTQLHQVVMNLGTNALQAMRDCAGRVDLTVEVVRREGESGEWVRLVVSDTGVGMDEATVSRAFEPFFTTRETGEGSGMGLAVVHGIASAHDGTVELASTPGKGTRVTVTFPCASTESATPDAPAYGNIRGTERVLLVDDEATVVEVVERILTKLGYRVTACSRPEEALEQCRGPDRFDLLITDQTMPGMTGVALAAAVHELRPSLPIILCSGHTDTLRVEQVRSVGIRELLWKPARLAELGSAVRRVIDEQAPSCEPRPS